MRGFDLTDSTLHFTGTEPIESKASLVLDKTSLIVIGYFKLSSRGKCGLHDLRLGS